jgi:flagellar P-ring protein precursor FlgI
VEREVKFSLAEHDALHLSLRNPDLTTAKRIEQAITEVLGPGVARATDPRTVELTFGNYRPVDALAEIEDLTVDPDTPAVVVVDEASGTIVMGDNVRISTVAIAQGNLTIRVSEAPLASQPGPFSGGRTTVIPRTSVQVDTGAGNKLGVLPSGPTLRDLVASLNALGVGPRDMISILQGVKAAGALQADLIVR